MDPAAARPSALLHGFDAAVSPDNVVWLVWLPWDPEGLQNTPHLLRLGIDKEPTYLPAPRDIHSPVLDWSHRRPTLEALGQEDDIVRIRYTWRGAVWHRARARLGAVSGFTLVQPTPGARHATAWLSSTRSGEARWNLAGPGLHGTLPVGPWESSHGRTRLALDEDAAVITWGGGVYLVVRAPGGWRAALLRTPARTPDATAGIATRFEDIRRVAVDTDDGGHAIAAWGTQGGEVVVWEGALDEATRSWDEVRWQALAGVGLTTAERAWLGEALLREAHRADGDAATCLRHIVAQGLGDSGGPGYTAQQQLSGAPVPAGCPAE